MIYYLSENYLLLFKGHLCESTNFSSLNLCNDMKIENLHMAVQYVGLCSLISQDNSVTRSDVITSLAQSIPL